MVRDGLFVSVPNPITSEAVNRIQAIVERAIKQENRGVRTVIFDFNPITKANEAEAGRPVDADSRDYGSCYELAKYIRQKSNNGIFTVAFLKAKVIRHSVLPVLACNEIIMSPEAAIGEVVDRTSPRPPDAETAYYEELAGPARKAIVQKMFDRNVRLMKGSLQQNGVMIDWFFDDRARNKKENADVINPQPLLEPGQPALYSAEEARRYNLCRLIKKSRQEVAEAYQLSPSSLREDPLQGRDPVVFKIELKGPVNSVFLERLNRRISAARSQRANVLVLQLECSNGDVVAAREVADRLLALQQTDGEKSPMQIIAYIPDEAPDFASFVAFACSEIVMRQAKTDEIEERQRTGQKERLLGDFEALVNDPNRAADLEAVRTNLREVLAAQGYPVVLADGLLSKDVVIHRVRGRIDATKRRLMTEEDYQADRQGPREWQLESTIKHKGTLLKLTPKLAEELGIVRFLIENRNVNEVYGRYGFDPAKVQEAGPDWLDALAEFLRRPAVATILVMLAIGGIFLELKAPGLAIPGIIGSLCVVLIFWSQWQAGGITTLAILLFVLGIVLLAIEIFILPGFGVTGISGILFIIVGLGLATVTRLPETSAEWTSFAMTLLRFGGAMIGGTIGALFVARYLPNIPYANRMMLKPPSEDSQGDDPLAVLPGAAQAAALLGAIGVTTTVLRPAGIARFGDQFVDVVSEGGYTESGTRVQVIEVEGNRIVVKPV